MSFSAELGKVRGARERENEVRSVEWEKRKQKFLWHLFFNPCVWRQHAATFCLFISRYAYAVCVHVCRLSPVYVCAAQYAYVENFKHRDENDCTIMG